MIWPFLGSKGVIQLENLIESRSILRSLCYSSKTREGKERKMVLAVLD
jgi:hypothetical protein